MDHRGNKDNLCIRTYTHTHPRTQRHTHTHSHTKSQTATHTDTHTHTHTHAHHSMRDARWPIRVIRIIFVSAHTHTHTHTHAHTLLASPAFKQSFCHFKCEQSSSPPPLNWVNTKCEQIVPKTPSSRLIVKVLSDTPAYHTINAQK